MTSPIFELMSLESLSAWVVAHNEVDGESMFDSMPETDELSDDEATEAHEEYVGMAYEIYAARRAANEPTDMQWMAALGPCGK